MEIVRAEAEDRSREEESESGGGSELLGYHR
jgi:hypothetical protein